MLRCAGPAYRVVRDLCILTAAPRMCRGTEADGRACAIRVPAQISWEEFQNFGRTDGRVRMLCTAIALVMPPPPPHPTPTHTRM